MAEIVGKDKILNYISKYHFRKIKISKGTDVVYTDAVKESGAESMLLDKLGLWIEDFIDPDNFKEYKLELFGTNSADPEAKLTPVIKISVQFNQKDYSGMNPRMSGFGGMDYKEYTAMAVENARLQSQIGRLEEKLDQLISGESEEEDKEETIMEKLGSVLLEKSDSIIDIILMKLAGTGNMAPQGMAGIENNYVSPEAISKVVSDESFENNCLDICWEFKEINPEIEGDLSKLLNLAKTNKPLFDLLIKQLRSM